MAFVTFRETALLVIAEYMILCGNGLVILAVLPLSIVHLIHTVNKSTLHCETGHGHVPELAKGLDSAVGGTGLMSES